MKCTFLLLVLTGLNLIFQNSAQADTYINTFCFDTQQAGQSPTSSQHDFELTVSAISDKYFRCDGKHQDSAQNSPTNFYGSAILSQSNDIDMTMIAPTRHSTTNYLIRLNTKASGIVAGTYQKILLGHSPAQTTVETGTIHLTVCDQPRTGSETIDNDDDGYTDAQGDCNDSDATVFPQAPEICGDGIDQNCDSIDDICDFDQDGYSTEIDCDDTNPNIHPGAQDHPFDKIDLDCNPLTYPVN